MKSLRNEVRYWVFLRVLNQRNVFSNRTMDDLVAEVVNNQIKVQISNRVNKVIK